MSSSAPTSNSNVNDIWSLPDPAPSDPVAPNPMPVKSSGKTGKPGISGGEQSGTWEPEQISEEATEIYSPPEILPVPETAEAEGEKPIKVHKAKPEPKAGVAEPFRKTGAKEKIVDKRTGKEKTHRVDVNNADPTTKTADIKEQEFIEGVETIHSLI